MVRASTVVRAERRPARRPAYRRDGRAPGPLVRPAHPADAAATAHLHARWLGSGFFPKLGPRFLRAYHASFARSPEAVALVAETGERAVGFLIGTLDNEAHYRWLTRHGAHRLALSGARALLADRQLLVRFLRTRARRYARSLRRRLGRQRPASNLQQTGASAAEEAIPSTVAVLTHVAVAPHARGTGTGRALVASFVERARAAGADEVRLISPAATGAPVFYRTLGWRSEGRRPASDGTLVEEFRLPL